MPSSNPETISLIVDIAWRLAPRSVLDIGAGYGKYGVLFREYCELRQSNGDHASAHERRRQVRVDALEGFAPYIGPLHEEVYDQIFVEDLVAFIEREWRYDLIFLGDVLEHIDREVALRAVMPALIDRSDMGVLVSVPSRVRRQEAVFGNDLEVHRSQWSTADFDRMAPYVYVGNKGSHRIAFLSRDPQSLQVVRGNALRQRLRRLRSALFDGW